MSYFTHFKCFFFPKSDSFFRTQIFLQIYSAVQNIYLAVLSGNRKLAGQLIDEVMKEPGASGFGYLHKDVSKVKYRSSGSMQQL